MMQSKHEFGPIALARVVNKLSGDRKNIQTCQTFIVRMLEQNQIKRNIEDFTPQGLAMLANGASKCGEVLATAVMSLMQESGVIETHIK